MRERTLQTTKAWWNSPHSITEPLIHIRTPYENSATIFANERASIESFQNIGYPYVNMKATLKHVLSILREAGFNTREVIKVYH